MKICYVGGGSLRILPELRALLKQPGAPAVAEIALHDHDANRVGAVAALLRQAPEAASAGVHVSVAPTLDEGIEGAAFVQVVACPWSGEYFHRCHLASRRQGFVPTDNVSPCGAFLSLHSAALALRVARRMEALAPNGTLICFTNPIGILAGAVNRNTRIRAVGICAGQANYVHNVAYIMGWPGYDWDLEAEAAGVNHISWFMALRLRGRDLMPDFTRQLDAGIDYDRLKPIGNYQELCVQFPRMIEAWKRFGVIHYSIEPEGLPVLSYYDEEFERHNPPGSAAPPPPPPPRPAPPAARTKEVEELIGMAGRDLGPSFWRERCPPWLQPWNFKACTGARVIKGLATDTPETLAASYLNRGAIEGFPSDVIMEYSARFHAGKITPHATYGLPPMVNGLTHMLVEFQTLAADGIAQEDADLFRKGLYAFPVCRSQKRVDALIKEIVAGAADELPVFARKLA